MPGLGEVTGIFHAEVRSHGGGAEFPVLCVCFSEGSLSDLQTHPLPPLPLALASSHTFDL